MGALLVGLETIANLMGRCLIYESLYITSLAGKFEGTIIELYAHILRYLIRASRYYTKNTAGKYNFLLDVKVYSIVVLMFILVRIAASTFDTTQGSLLDDINAQEVIVVRTAAIAEAKCEFARI